MYLFSDAKLTEDVAEDFVGGDGLAEDGAEGFEGVPKILGDEVGRGAGSESGADAGEGSAGFREGLVMPDIADQSILSTHCFVLPRGDKTIFQFGDSKIEFRRDT